MSTKVPKLKKPKFQKPHFQKQFDLAFEEHQNPRAAFLVVAEKQVRYVYGKYKLPYNEDAPAYHANLMCDGWEGIQREIQKKQKALLDEVLWKLAWNQVCEEFDAHIGESSGKKKVQSRGRSRTAGPGAFANANEVPGTYAHSIPHSKSTPHTGPQVKHGGQRMPQPPPRHSTIPAETRYYQTYQTELREPGGRGVQMPPPPTPRQYIIPAGKHYRTILLEPGGAGRQHPPPSS
jgi:hypothetical protein